MENNADIKKLQKLLKREMDNCFAVEKEKKMISLIFELGKVYGVIDALKCLDESSGPVSRVIMGGKDLDHIVDLQRKMFDKGFFS